MFRILVKGFEKFSRILVKGFEKFCRILVKGFETFLSNPCEMQTQLAPRDVEIALLHGAHGVSSAQPSLTILSMFDFGKALKKVLEDACCGNLWKRELISDY